MASIDELLDSFWRAVLTLCAFARWIFTRDNDDASAGYEDR